MDFNILLRLLFAHVLCDFLCQSDKLVEDKGSENTTVRLRANLIHAAIHAAAAYIVAAMWEAWYIPVAMFVSHFLIDFLYKKGKKNAVTFFVDQLLHLIVIVLIWLFVSKQFAEIPQYITYLFGQSQLWAIAFAYLLMLKPTGIFIGLFTRRWSRQFENAGGDDIRTKDLKSAGKWIGYIERILIVTFIFVGSWEAIGFLLAAKSIFRYGDLNSSHEIRRTEYVLIGTLASFAIAIFTGILFKFAI